MYGNDYYKSQKGGHNGALVANTYGDSTSRERFQSGGNSGSKCSPTVIIAVVVAVLVLVAIIVGTAVGVSQGLNNNNGGNTPGAQPTSPPTDDCSTVEIGKEVRFGSDHVGVVFSACPSEAAFLAFTNAARRWSRVITKTEIGPVTVNQAFTSDDACGENFLENQIPFDAGFVIDHLVVFAETVDIDGVNGILAQAGPCILTSGFSSFGGMQFDNADVDKLEQDGTLEIVILHEMGHVLGIGTLFGNLLVDKVFADNGQIFPGNQPKFLGTTARTEFGAVGGNPNFVPVEDGSGFFNLAAGQGRGSVDSHWDINTFFQELMVFQINKNIQDHPLSRITIASLQDIGYTVSFDEADSFTPTLVTSTTLNLRGDSKDAAYLFDDIKMPHAPVDVNSEDAFWAAAAAKKKSP